MKEDMDRQGRGARRRCATALPDALVSKMPWMENHMNSRTVLAACLVTLTAAGVWRMGEPAGARAAGNPPVVVGRKTPVITKDGLKFKDLNKNGTLEPYEDWRLPVDERVRDLVSRLTLEEKAGLMIHTTLSGYTGPNGEVLGIPAPRAGGGRQSASATPLNRAFEGPPNPNHVDPMEAADPKELIAARNIRWILVRPNPGEAPEVTANFHNSLQEMAESSRLGIPIVFSTDPRHAVPRTGEVGKPVLSQWPDQLGLAAGGDPESVRRFGQIAARELRALGIQCLLGPMADTTTEPRWNRINGTFGEDANLNAILVKAFIEGFQGKQLGPDSVMTVTKHFPGDGPVKDGYDPHSNYGKWTIYPGDKFDYHLLPFKAAFEAGTGGIMGGYFIPVGKDTVAVNFSKAMLTSLLREKMGFQGLVVTDWLRINPWGVEKLSEKDRQKLIVLAGADQIGGDNDPKYILANVKDGSTPAALIDAAVRRVLRPMFQLGVFENPYVDPENARITVASEGFLKTGYDAQLRSTVLLKNASGLLPLATNKKIFVQGIDPAVAGAYGAVVTSDPRDADIAILRVASPATLYPYGGAFTPGAAVAVRRAPQPPPLGRFGVTLAYGNADNWDVLDNIKKIAASGKPTVVIVNMDRPVILTEFIDDVQAVFGAFGASDRAILDLVYGKAAPAGKLPFDLPSDMVSVMSQAADVPFDMEDPLFKFGFGLTYSRH